MDSIEVTINRTAAATTLAARHLARPDSRIATVCGAGVQGRIQLVAIAAAAPLERVNIWDARPEMAERLAREMSAALKLDIRAVADLSAVRQSDIIVTCTSARQRFLTPDLVRPGHLHRRRRRRQFRQAGDRPCALCGKPRGRRFARTGRRDRRPAPCAGGRRRHDGPRPRHAGRDPGRRQAGPPRSRRHHLVRQHRHGPAGRRRRCRHLPARARHWCGRAPFPDLRRPSCNIVLLPCSAGRGL